MQVAFFISGHGFGHASRQVEVINALGARRPAFPIVIRSAVNPDLLKRTLRVPDELRPGACDTGIVQSSSVAHDDEATVRAAIDFHGLLGARADAEARALGSDTTLIVGDVPPLAFEVASRLDIPAVGIANFTWDWIYEAYPAFADTPWLVPALRAVYGKATLGLELPFSCGLQAFPIVRPLPLIARRPTRTPSDTRARFGIPRARPAALLSFGGYGLPSLDLWSLDRLSEWTIVTTDRINITGAALPSHVVALTEGDAFTSGFRYEDLVAAVDVVVTKPGYGIIAECVAAGTSMLYTSRGHFREYDVLVNQLPDFVRCKFISHADLFAGRWHDSLTTLIDQPSPPRIMATNGADVAAEMIGEMVGQEH